MPPRAVLFTFTTITRKFSTLTERNQFYRGLYGWKQVVRRGTRTYVYEREGILSETPHYRVDKSTIIVPLGHSRRVEEYLDSWTPKVRYSRFIVLVDRDTWNRMMTTHKKTRDNQE